MGTYRPTRSDTLKSCLGNDPPSSPALTPYPQIGHGESLGCFLEQGLSWLLTPTVDGRPLSSRASRAPAREEPFLLPLPLPPGHSRPTQGENRSVGGFPAEGGFSSHSLKHGLSLEPEEAVRSEVLPI